MADFIQNNKGEEALNNDAYYRDETRITAIQAEIANAKKDDISQEIATWIRQKKFGIDVRESIARSVEWNSAKSLQTEATANAAVEKSKETADNFAKFEDRYNNQIAGNTSLSEVIDSRVAKTGEIYKTLKERLDNYQNNYLISDDFELGGNEIRDIFKPALESTKAKIDSSKFNIAYGSDFHVDERKKRRYVNAELAYSHFNNLLYFDDKVDVTVVNGDNIDAMYSSLDRIRIETEAVVSKFFDTETKSDVFIHLGNHDDGSGRGKDNDCPLDGFLKLKDYKKIYRTEQLLNGETRNNGSLYYFKDYPDKKIRLIGLYTEDITETATNGNGFLKYTRWLTHTIQQEQMDWLINVALANVPSDYHTLVIGHTPLYYGWTDDGAKQINHDYVKNVLRAFQTGGIFNGTSTDPDFPLTISCDFTKQGPRKFVGFFAGHTHREALFDWDGIKIIHLLHSIDSRDSTNGNTDKEDALNVISIDTKANKVKLIGFGRSTDREFTY